MTSLFFTLSVAIFVALIVLKFLGAFLFELFQIKSSNRYFSNFQHLVVATLLTVCLYAIYKTAFNTVFIGVLLLGVLLIVTFFRNRLGFPRKKAFLAQFNIKVLMEYAIMVIVLLLYRFQFFSDIFGLTISSFEDISFYSKLAHYLNLSGTETYVLYGLYSNEPTPYHYLELWLTSLAGNFLGKINPTTLIGFTYTWLSVLSYAGLLALAEALNMKMNFLIKVIAFLVLGVGGIYLLFYENNFLTSSADVYAWSVLITPKLLVVLPFLCFSAIFLIKKEFFKGLLSVLMLPLFYFTTAPAIFGTVLIFIIALGLKKLISTKEIVFLVVSIVLVYGFLIIFYVVYGNVWGLASNSPIQRFFDKGYITTIINILAGSTIKILVVYIPYLFLLVNYKKLPFKTHRFLFLFLVLLYVVGLLSWAITHGSLNSIQLFTNVLQPMVTMVIFVLIVYQLQVLSGMRKMIMIFYFMLLIAFVWVREYRVNQDELKNLRKVVSKEFVETVYGMASSKGNIGGFIRSPNYYGTENALHMSEVTYSMDLPIQHVEHSSKLHTYSLSTFNIEPERFGIYERSVERMKKNGPFFKFMEKNKFERIERAQLDFVIENVLKYILVDKDAELPYIFEDKFRLYSVDNMSGMKLYVFRAQY